MQSKMLITGFEPFGGSVRNPSDEIVRAIVKSDHADSLIAEILPVEYDAAHRRIEQLMLQHQPRAWLGFGLNQRASAIMLERVAFNLDEATIADNAGTLRRGQPVDPTGPITYRSTLPLEAIAAELRGRNIAAAFSDSAGRFVCNHLFYRAMNFLGRSNSTAIGGFIHIPWPADWDPIGSPCHTVTLATIIEAAQACVSTILRESRHQKDSPT